MHLEDGFMSPVSTVRARFSRTVWLCVLASACGWSSAKESEGLALEPCRLPDVQESLACGTLEVRENPEQRTSRRIGIHVTVARATSPARADDPLVLFVGGPGIGASSSVGTALARWAPVRERRDLVFVDLRGTGKSRPLGCRLPGDPSRPTTYLRSMFEPDIVRSCRDSLAASADLTMYATSRSVEDMDHVRRALGYETVNIYGVSYGSLVAQQYLRRHGEHVRAAILHAPVPTTGDRLLIVPQLLDSLIARTVWDCMQDTACRTTYPDIGSHLQRLTSRILPDTVTAVIADPTVAGDRAVRIPYSHLAELLQLLLYSVDDAAELPPLLELLANQRIAPLVPVITRLRRNLYGERIAWGLYLSVFCAEMVPYERSAEMLARARATVARDGEIRELLGACALWPRAEIPPDFREPVVSPVPTLILSGELDPVTPPVLGSAIAQHLTNAKHVVIRNTAHDVGQGTWDTCVGKMVTEFIETADPAGVDVTCATHLRRPQFAGTATR